MASRAGAPLGLLVSQIPVPDFHDIVCRLLRLNAPGCAPESPVWHEACNLKEAYCSAWGGVRHACRVDALSCKPFISQLVGPLPSPGSQLSITGHDAL